MVALTTVDTVTDTKGHVGLTIAIPIEDGETVFLGGIVSELAGVARPYQAAAGEVVLGRCVGFEGAGDEGSDPDGETGDAAGSVLAVIEIGETVLRRVVISDLAALTEVGNDVFVITDNPQDIIMTQPGAQVTNGRLVRFHAANDGDVLLFAYADQVAAP